jgi:hypothetical protein
MRRLTILVTSPLLLLALAACGDPAVGPDVASADGATPTASASASTSTAQGDPVKFADCLREHGVDVQLEQGGGMRIHGKPGDEGKMTKAQEACRKYAPSGGPGKGKPMSKADQERFLKFAQCMRDHGIPMQDPKFSGGGVQLGIQQPKGAARLDDAKVEAAQKACQSNLPEEMRPGSNGGPRQGGPGSGSDAGGTTGGGA